MHVFLTIYPPHKTFRIQKIKKSAYVYEDGVDVIGTVVPLKRGDVGPEIVGCKAKRKMIQLTSRKDYLVDVIQNTQNTP